MNGLFSGRGVVSLAALIGLAFSTQAADLKKMTIATGVDPSFSQFYVAKQAGIFEKNGLDVQVNTGPSGSAMVAFLIGNQINAAYGAEQAGITAHAVDPNVVAVADGVTLTRWLSVVGSKDVPSLDALKGKKIGVARGTGSETFWNAVIKAKKLNPSDYEIVNVEAPEMVAAIERGNIDAFAIWEPWPTRAMQAVKGTQIIATNETIFTNHNFIYMNKSWIAENEDTSKRFVTSLLEATDFIKANPDKAAGMVSAFLKQPEALVKELMPKVNHTMELTDTTRSNIQVAIDQLNAAGKLKKPVTANEMILPDLLKSVKADAVTVKMD